MLPVSDDALHRIIAADATVWADDLPSSCCDTNKVVESLFESLVLIHRLIDLRLVVHSFILVCPRMDLRYHRV